MRSWMTIYALAAWAAVSGASASLALDLGIWMDEAALATTFKDKSVTGEYASGRDTSG